MNKNTKRILGVVFAAFIAALWFGQSRYSIEPAVSSKSIELQQQKKERDKQLGLIKSLKEKDPIEAEKQMQGFLEALPEKFKRHYILGFEAGIEKIAFHGQVIDQYGNPVTGARVEFEAGGRYLAAGSGRGLLMTNDDGRFRFNAEGGNLIVGPIVHPELDEFKHLAINEGNQILTRVTFFGYQHAKDGNDLIWTDYSAENPYVFNVWRKTKVESLGSFYKGSLSPRLKCDGSKFTFDFSQKKVEYRMVSGEAKGQIRVRYYCTKTNDSDGDGAASWSVEIEAVDGGIQEAQDIYLNQAPERGYDPSYKISMRKDESEYKDRAVKSFYFTANNGEFYGSIRAEFFPFMYEKPKIFMEYKVNTTSDRSLLKK